MVENAGLLVPEVEFVSDWHPWNAGRRDRSNRRHRRRASVRGRKRINVGADLAGLNLPLAALKDPFRRMCDVADAAGMTLALEMIAWGRISTLEAACELVAAAAGAARGC